MVRRSGKLISIKSGKQLEMLFRMAQSAAGEAIRSRLHGYIRGQKIREDTMAVTAADKTAEAMHAANRAEEGAEDLSVHCRPDSADAASASSAESPDAGASPIDPVAALPPYERLASMAYHAMLNRDGVAVLPAGWDGDGDADASAR